MAIEFSDFLASNLDGRCYASAVARWLHDRIDGRMTIINLSADFLEHGETVEDFITEHSSEVDFNTQIPRFIDGQQGEMITFEDMLHAFAEDDSATLSFAEASAVLEDMSASVGAANSCTLAIDQLASDIPFSLSDFMASIDATFGGLSDTMVTFTSVVGTIFSNSSLSIKDKIHQAFLAMGWLNDDFTGIGFPTSLFQEYTGFSGVQAIGAIFVDAVTNVVEWVTGVVTKVVSFLDKVLGGLITKISNRVNEALSVITTVGDAYNERKDDDDVSEPYCEGSQTFIIYPPYSSEHPKRKIPIAPGFVSKLSDKYMVHFPLAFCCVDMWLANANTGQGIESGSLIVRITWKPVASSRLIDLDNFSGVSLSGMINGSVKSSTLIYDLYAMYSERETEQQARDFMAKLSDIANYSPASGNVTQLTGIPFLDYTMDMPIHLGIKAAQACFFSSVMQHYCPVPLDDDTDVVARFTAAGLDIDVNTMPGNITNKAAFYQGVLKPVGSTTLFGTDEFARIGASVTYHSNFGFGEFLYDLTSHASNFSVSGNTPSDSTFVPYFYLADSLNQRYYIMTDGDIRGVMSNILKVIAIVIIAIVGWKLVSVFKQKLFIARSSLDYQVFAQDLALNHDAAIDLYKRSKRLRLVSLVGEKICGTIKGSISAAVSTITSAVQAIGGLGTSNLSGASGASSSAVDLKDIKDLITG